MRLNNNNFISIKNSKMPQFDYFYFFLICLNLIVYVFFFYNFFINYFFPIFFKILYLRKFKIEHFKYLTINSNLKILKNQFLFLEYIGNLFKIVKNIIKLS